MKKVMSLLLCGAMLAGMLSGCGSAAAPTKEAAATAAETEAASEEAAEPAAEEPAAEETAAAELTELKVWHDGDEAIMQVMADAINTALEDDQITVSFEKKAGLTDQLKLYGNDAANGPDMYFYAHDSLGMFAEMGILEPISDVLPTAAMADLLPMTVEAGTYQGTQYVVPAYFETLLFMYNKALWEGEVPATTEELYAYMEQHTSGDTYAVVNQHSTAYNVAPFINGFGGYIINGNAEPGLNDAKTIEAVEYNQKFAKLQADGDYNTVTTLFNEGKAAAIVGGPWLVSGIKDAGIDLGIKSLADFKLPNGNGLAPYAGVQGFGVLKYAAEGKKDAIAKALTVIAGSEVGVALAKNSNCAPANAKAYEDADVAANEMIAAIRATAETAEPMPNVPQMSVMWGPTEALLAAVNKSGEDAATVAETYQKEAETAIADMQ